MQCRHAHSCRSQYPTCVGTPTYEMQSITWLDLWSFMSSRTSFLHQSPIRIPSHVPKPLWKSNSMQAFALVQLWYVMSVLSPSTLGIKPKYPRPSDIYVIQCGRNNMVAISWINTIFAPRSGDFDLNTLVQLWTWDWQPLHCIYWCGQVFKHTHVCIPMGLFTQPPCMGCTQLRCVS